MQLICAKCKRTLEYSGDRPSFCAYCGQALGMEKTTPTPVHGDEAPTLAGPPGSAPAPDVPKTVGGYRILRELGSGGMGTVYDAEDAVSGRHVALKLIAPEFVRSPDAVERFRQEGRIASMIAHPRCVFVLAVDEEAGRPYIVMERMPGATLKDLVAREGPLPPQRAIALILDVIEGLQEAHRLDVIHRDVKPSNCFVDTDGRVKVGDFGLAKSLVKDAHLTRTGAFVGTPHFASPEQVRGEAIDARTDVYSTAAALYYLLTGKPPFHGSDSGAALARILTDPPPRIRRLRPELSPALEQIILRGLERDLDRRWPDLHSFGHALRALSPQPLTWPDQGPRLLAYLFDFVLLRAMGLGVLFMLNALLSGNETATSAQTAFFFEITFAVVFILYFAGLERAAGCSLGKRLLSLRVCSLAWANPPSMGRALTRAIVLFVLLNAGFLVESAIELAGAAIWNDSILTALVIGWSWLAWDFHGISIMGAALAASTMKDANGFRGLHEVLSGTRVIRLAASGRRRISDAGGGWLLSFLLSRRLEKGAQSGGLPERIAGFTIRGALKWTPTDKLLLGEDASLGRRVFLWLRPQSAPALTPARRNIGRPTRLRWLASGKQGDLQWDALLAPSGSPLPDFVQTEGVFSWPGVRAVLLELANELVAACADDTLPHSLSLAQVWIHTDGRVQLADLAVRDHPEPREKTDDNEQRGMILLRQVADLLLEGKTGAAHQPHTRGAAALPDAARRIVERLLGTRSGFATIREARDALAESVEYAAKR
jgi:hypothetical protein